MSSRNGANTTCKKEFLRSLNSSTSAFASTTSDPVGSSGTSRDRLPDSNFGRDLGAHEPLLEAYFPELEYPDLTLDHFYYERFIEFAGTESRTKDKKEARGKWLDSGCGIQRRLDELSKF